MNARAEPQTPVITFDEFLVAQEWRALLDFTLASEPQFAHTEVIGSDGVGRLDTDYRRSRVLFDLGHFRDLFTQRLTTFLPLVLHRTGQPPFALASIETQLTGTNNSEFFRMHTDNDATAVNTRVLTFVYFFHREPQSFAGGELRIYDSYRQGQRTLASGPYRIVYPLQNQIVFFPSGVLHEVLPVGCPSGAFCDSRFTVNGWFHQ
jgi:Rps23 Pro-64 3,4-dihydroxylase Tpa1-like proline 4-hydroxylase